jgi:hypothetical protein
MNPPNVYEVTMPRSQRMHNTTKIVQSIAIPISRETLASSACTAIKNGLWRVSSELNDRFCECESLFT